MHLAAVERVVRAQHFEGSRSFPHFSVLGLVSAGRDVGTKVFERESMESHLDALLAICHAAGFPEVEVKLTDFGGRHQMVIDELIASMSRDALTVVEWPDRTAAQGYYPSLCFKISVTTAEGPVEIGDGGLVRWTEALVASRKERLMISGLSIERLALVTAPTSSH